MERQKKECKRKGAFFRTEWIKWAFAIFHLTEKLEIYSKRVFFSIITKGAKNTKNLWKKTHAFTKGNRDYKKNAVTKGDYIYVERERDTEKKEDVKKNEK